jgi:1-acyl-sn-glycerol-3-phosphate acyltransferase
VADIPHGVNRSAPGPTNTDDTDRDDLETLSEALLTAVEEDIEEHTGDGSDALPDAAVTALKVLRRVGIEFVHRYHRLDIEGDFTSSEPVLFVANHGFGGIFDLNVLAIFAAFDQLSLDRPVSILTHELFWTFQMGPLIEPLGCRPASWENARAAFRDGHHVLVLPGGDVDAFKAYGDRNKIVFAGRTGFARLSMETGRPIVPIVTIGAGESLFVISDGQRLARALRLDKTLRAKALPVSVSLPWGLNVGAVGLLPYIPLPTKLSTRVLPAMSSHATESPTQFATRVQIEMQHALSAMAEERRFVGRSSNPT